MTAAGSKNALVADQDTGSRELLRILLEREGYRVMEAADASEAVSATLGVVPELIFIDVELPVYGGYAAVRELRRDQRLEGCVIVAMTANDTDDSAEELRTAGFTDRMAKPVLVRSLNVQLRKFLRGQREM